MFRHRYLTDTGFETVTSRKHSSPTALLCQVFGSKELPYKCLNVQNIYIGANGNTQAVGNFGNIIQNVHVIGSTNPDKF